MNTPTIDPDTLFVVLANGGTTRVTRLGTADDRFLAFDRAVVEKGHDRPCRSRCGHLSRK
ncbi:hypothetical protein ACFWAY_48145 [Rhodococcus sp. NPDC059968]|uniref:hypothetical protein n=1 Tax=Rhodococcus sp. NPDC059968 TaxID=3347017 RepID=UPI00366AFCE1